MVGPVTPVDPAADPMLADTATAGGIKGFLATTIGKIIVGGVLVMVLAGAIGAIAFFYFLNQAPDDGLVITPNTGGSSVTTQTIETPTQRPSPRLENHFTFRNVFRPTVRPAVVATASAEGTGSPTLPGGAEIPPDTLYLQGVTVVDGDEIATLIWNGQTFTSGQGDVLTGTPWKVVSIQGDTVTLLFGDSRVTLVVGQGVGK